MMDAVDQAVNQMNSPSAPRCSGWNPDDPEGCWMHDGPTGGIDYCDGFRLFFLYDDAVTYGEGLRVNFALGFDSKAQQWAVTQLDGNYGS